MPDNIEIETKDFFPALEISATVEKTPSGDYVVHIEDLNGAVELPLWTLEHIAEWAQEVTKKDAGAS